MRKRTPEQDKAAAAQAHVTRRANKEARLLARQAELESRDTLKVEIYALEKRLAELQRMEVVNGVAAAITGTRMLRPDEITAAAVPWTRHTGVYFLLHRGEVVYVGQSVNVYSRIAQHTFKEFDSFAYIPCRECNLDKLESLYIHVLQPRLNGRQSNGALTAPLSFHALLGTEWL